MLVCSACCNAHFFKQSSICITQIHKTENRSCVEHVFERCQKAECKDSRKEAVTKYTNEKLGICCKGFVENNYEQYKENKVTECQNDCGKYKINTSFYLAYNCYRSKRSCKCIKERHNIPVTRTKHCKAHYERKQYGRALSVKDCNNHGKKACRNYHTKCISVCTQRKFGSKAGGKKDYYKEYYLKQRLLQLDFAPERQQ